MLAASLPPATTLLHFDPANNAMERYTGVLPAAVLVLVLLPLLLFTAVPSHALAAPAASELGLLVLVLGGAGVCRHTLTVALADAEAMKPSSGDEQSAKILLECAFLTLWTRQWEPKS